MRGKVGPDIYSLFPCFLFVRQFFVQVVFLPNFLVVFKTFTLIVLVALWMELNGFQVTTADHDVQWNTVFIPNTKQSAVSIELQHSAQCLSSIYFQELLSSYNTLIEDSTRSS